MGFILGVLWAYYRRPIGFLWDSYCFPIGFLFHSLGYALRGVRQMLAADERALVPRLQRAENLAKHDWPAEHFDIKSGEGGNSMKDRDPDCIVEDPLPD